MPVFSHTWQPSLRLSSYICWNQFSQCALVNLRNQSTQKVEATQRCEIISHGRMYGEHAARTGEEGSLAGSSVVGTSVWLLVFAASSMQGGAHPTLKDGGNADNGSDDESSLAQSTQDRDVKDAIVVERDHEHGN